MTKLLEGDQLEQRARKLGVDIMGEPRTQFSSGLALRAPDYELQRRIAEAERSICELRLWIVALISAAASVFSAIGALVAVAWK